MQLFLANHHFTNPAFSRVLWLTVHLKTILRFSHTLACDVQRPTLQDKRAGIILQCTSCTTSIPLWDTHTLCGNCRPCTAVNQQGCWFCTQWEPLSTRVCCSSFTFGTCHPSGSRHILYRPHNSTIQRQGELFPWDSIPTYSLSHNHKAS